MSWLRSFIFAVIFTIFSISIINYSMNAYKEDQDNIEAAKALGLEHDGGLEAECSLACYELDKKMFKHEFSSGMFGADVNNCWCSDSDGEVNQVY